MGNYLSSPPCHEPVAPISLKRRFAATVTSEEEEASKMIGLYDGSPTSNKKAKPSVEVSKTTKPSAFNETNVPMSADTPERIHISQFNRAEASSAFPVDIDSTELITVRNPLTVLSQVETLTESGAV